jgi:hypothetical protein
MIYPIIAIIICFGAYVLLVKGLLYKLILGIGGVFGIYIYLENNVTSTAAQVFQNPSLGWIHWSLVIPSILFVLALATTKE